MRKLEVFNNISLDGYFSDRNNDMSWAHQQDPEWMSFVSSNASGEAALLLGRISFEQMEAFWPTPQASALMPEVARGMARSPKIVFSNTRRESDWTNTQWVSGNVVEVVRGIKATAGPDLVILGSGSLISPLIAVGLVDVLRLAVHPLFLGDGRKLVEVPAALQRAEVRSFGNGCVVLTYRCVN